MQSRQQTKLIFLISNLYRLFLSLIGNYRLLINRWVFLRCLRLSNQCRIIVSTKSTPIIIKAYLTDWDITSTYLVGRDWLCPKIVAEPVTLKKPKLGVLAQVLVIRRIVWGKTTFCVVNVNFGVLNISRTTIEMLEK